MKCTNWRALFFLVCLFVFALGVRAQNVITTVAGSAWVFRGDGGPAVDAPLGNTSGVGVDATGAVYATDNGNCLVVKILPSGVLRVVAGSGICGYSGDGGPATAASLRSPSGVAVDPAGNLYIADADNARIRQVSPAGIITTVAGNGVAGFSGDGGPATSASLSGPSGVAVDATGNLYIADTGNKRIRKVIPGRIIGTVAGGGSGGDGGPATSASLSSPEGVAVDAAGNVYIADAGNSCIRWVTPAGAIFRVAGSGSKGFSGDGGPSTSAALNQPSGVAVDAAGNLYVADSGNNRIRRVTSAGGTITTVAGSGTGGYSGDVVPATSASLWDPGGVAVDATGNLYIADTMNYRIRKVTPTGVIRTVAGNGQYKFSGDGGPATAAALSRPTGVAVGGAGNLYIADTYNNRIRKVSPAGIMTTVAGNGLAIFSGDGGPGTSASLLPPSGVAVDAAGNLYIADAWNHRIRKVSPAGIISTLAGNGAYKFSGDGGPATAASLAYPWGAAVDAAGNLYIADRDNNRIRKVSPSGIITTVAGGGSGGDGGPSASASLRGPVGVALDAAGNLYIADRGNQRIRKVSPGGIISTVAGSGILGYSGDGGPATAAALSQPTGVTVDAAGNLYIADLGNNRIRKVNPFGMISGTITTVAGYGVTGYSGDGGPATSGSLTAPCGVAVDAAGNLYIADTGNDRIRTLWAAVPSFAASPASLVFSATAGSAASTAQQVTLSSAAAGLGWTATARTSSGGDWLSVSPASGQIPATISVSVNASNLAAGTYQGSIAISVAVASPSLVTVAVTLTAAPGVPFEPELTRFLNPGFYILEATLASGAAAGFWGLEVLTSVGQAAGGFNLGGALHPASSNTPGFGAFMLSTPQKVTANLNAQVPSGTSLTMRFLDSNKTLIGSPVSGAPPLQLSASLPPGFYVVEVYNGAPSAVTYQLGLVADFFSGGVDTGGYLAPDTVGFGAFYVPVAQNVTMKLYGQKTYGSAGAGSMILTLRDSNRQILQVVGP